MDPIANSAPPPADPWVGQTLVDKYQINELIAAGGMGRVYSAMQMPINRSVAVKILSPRTANKALQAEFRERFFREAATCGRLHHPNTVTLFDYGRLDDNTLFMVMEFARGRTLKQILREDGPLDPARAIHIAHEIALSLREAHHIGVVHRDLKPSNVIIREDRDDRLQVKVLDFGLVKLLEPETSANHAMGTSVRDVVGKAELTAIRQGVLVGSPCYMAPEQIQSQNVDRRADIYALGVILYECLTGRPPFRGVNPIETLMQHVSMAPPPMSEANPAIVVPDEVEDFVHRCLAKKPEDRFQRIDDVVTTLRAAIPPDVLHDFQRPSHTPAPIMGPLVAQSPWPSILAGAVLVAVVALGLLGPRLWTGNAATLTITSSPPNAQVLEGGKAIGTTPYLLLGDQPHDLTLHLDGHDDIPVRTAPISQDAQRHVVLKETPVNRVRPDLRR